MFVWLLHKNIFEASLFSNEATAKTKSVDGAPIFAFGIVIVLPTTKPVPP